MQQCIGPGEHSIWNKGKMEASVNSCNFLLSHISRKYWISKSIDGHLQISAHEIYLSCLTSIKTNWKYVCPQLSKMYTQTYLIFIFLGPVEFENELPIICRVSGLRVFLLCAFPSVSRVFKPCSLLCVLFPPYVTMCCRKVSKQSFVHQFERNRRERQAYIYS